MWPLAAIPAAGMVSKPDCCIHNCNRYVCVPWEHYVALTRTPRKNAYVVRG